MPLATSLSWSLYAQGGRDSEPNSHLYLQKGGKLKTGPNRKPVQENKPCSLGKYMYYGWEDRPACAGPRPGVNNWTDEDYDDIRLVVECPNTASGSGKRVQLVH